MQEERKMLSFMRRKLLGLSDGFNGVFPNEATNVKTVNVPVAFGVSNLRIDGNKANNSSGSGLNFFGKKYIINNVTIHNCADQGFYSECGSYRQTGKH